MISKIREGSNTGILAKAQLSPKSVAFILEYLIKSYDSNELSQKTINDLKEMSKNIFDLYEDLQI